MALYRTKSVASSKSQYLPVDIPKPNLPYGGMEGLEYHPTFTPTPALLRLPNQVLDQVAPYLVPSTVVHKMEGTSLARGPRPSMVRRDPAGARVSPRSAELSSQEISLGALRVSESRSGLPTLQAGS